MNRRWSVAALAAGMFVLALGSFSLWAQEGGTPGLAPWASNTDPTDVAKRHVEVITSGKHEYTVTQGGTMDGLSTRIPPGIWQPWSQTWESNRVVALDDKGNRSWSSSYAEAPRPFIHTQPVTKTKVGQVYSYAPGVIRSIGDLRKRAGKEDKGAAFWDIEQPVFALEQAPDWLKLDPETGTLSGTPEAPGKFEVILAASLQREERKLNSASLAWGNEKLKGSTSTKTLGPVTQKFVIEVDR